MTNYIVHFAEKYHEYHGKFYNNAVIKFILTNKKFKIIRPKFSFTLGQQNESSLYKFLQSVALNFACRLRCKQKGTV